MTIRPDHARDTILVVDDDDAIVELVMEVLSDEGYAVTIMRDAGLEAIQEAVTQLQPDCMLLDGGVGSGYRASWASASHSAAAC